MLRALAGAAGLSVLMAPIAADAGTISDHGPVGATALGRADVASGTELAHRCGPTTADSGGLADGQSAGPRGARTDPDTADFTRAVVRQVDARSATYEPVGSKPVDAQPVDAQADGAHAVTTYERTSEHVAWSATSRQARRGAHVTAAKCWSSLVTASG